MTSGSRVWPVILHPVNFVFSYLFSAFRAWVVGFEVEALDFRFVVVTLLGLLLLLLSSYEISLELQIPCVSVSASSLSISSSLLQSTSSSSLELSLELSVQLSSKTNPDGPFLRNLRFPVTDTSLNSRSSTKRL